jgi:hypothetical protein
MFIPPWVGHQSLVYDTELRLMKVRPNTHTSYPLRSVNTGEIFLMNMKDNGRSFCLQTYRYFEPRTTWGLVYKTLSSVCFWTWQAYNTCQFQHCPTCTCHVVPCQSALYIFCYIKTPRILEHGSPEASNHSLVAGTPIISIWLASAPPAFIYVHIYSWFNDIFNC